MEHHNLWNKYEKGNFQLSWINLSFLSKFAQNFLFTQNEQKQNLYLKWAPFKYPKWKFSSEMGHFVSLPKLTQTYFNFKMSKFKISKMSNIKICILEIS